MCRWHSTTGQHNIDRRSRIGCLQYCVTGQGWERLAVTIAFGKITRGATVQINLRAMRIDNAVVQGLGDFVVRGKGAAELAGGSDFRYLAIPESGIVHVLRGMRHRIIHAYKRSAIAVAAGLQKFRYVGFTPWRQSDAVLVTQR